MSFIYLFPSARNSTAQSNALRQRGEENPHLAPSTSQANVAPSLPHMPIAGAREAEDFFKEHSVSASALSPNDFSKLQAFINEEITPIQKGMKIIEFFWKEAFLQLKKDVSISKKNLAFPSDGIDSHTQYVMGIQNDGAITQNKITLFGLRDKFKSLVEEKLTKEKDYINKILDFIKWSTYKVDMVSNTSIALITIRQLIYKARRCTDLYYGSSEFQARDKRYETPLGVIEDFFTIKWVQLIIKNIKNSSLNLKVILTATQILENDEKGARHTFSDSLDKKIFWNNLINFRCVIPWSFWNYTPIEEDIPTTTQFFNNFFTCYHNAEQNYANKNNNDDERDIWIQGERRFVPETEALSHSHQFEMITDNRACVCHLLSNMLKEIGPCHGDIYSKSIYQALFGIFDHIDLAFVVIDLEKDWPHGAIEKLRTEENITHLIPQDILEREHIFNLYLQSSIITKKYFFKTLLEDDVAIKALLDSGEEHSFHYKFIEYAIEKNGVSLFLSEDLPPTTVFNNEYAVFFCRRIFEKLVKDGKLNVSSEVNKKMEDFFSHQLEYVSIDVVE